MQLRNWQESALNQARGQQVFFVEAVMGAGKTTFACAWLKERRPSFVVVVVPTRSLVGQWTIAAGAAGVCLRAFRNWQGTELPRDIDGILTTYAAVARQPEAYRRFQRVCLVLDEVHHCAETTEWGAAVLGAFSSPAFVLGLSGTPFRNDGRAIPFLPYTGQMGQPHYVYSYSHGLGDGVVRPVTFIPYSGDFKRNTLENAAQTTASFRQGIEDDQAARTALKLALDPQTGWLAHVIGEGDKLLRSVRKHVLHNAGGMIVAKSIPHAVEVAAIVKQVTGRVPPLIVSDAEVSTTRVDQFANSDLPWLVSVKKVSEGVDIPRLMVGVYATNVLTQLYFRQWVGRFIRATPTPRIDRQMAYCLIPGDHRLVGMAIGIEDEIAAYLKTAVRQKTIGEQIAALDLPCGTSAEDQAEAPVITLAEPPRFRHIVRRGRQLQLPGLEAQPTATIEMLVPRGEPAAPAAPAAHEDSHDALRETVRLMVGRRVKATGETWESVYSQLKRLDGASLSSCTTPQLKRRIAWLQQGQKRGFR